jgi:hypothetical protein
MVAKLLDRCFTYLNKFYLKGKKLPFTGESALKIFVDNCFYN